VISGGNKEKIEKGYLRLEGNFSYCRFRISLAASFASFFHFFSYFSVTVICPQRKEGVFISR